jgi:hypothetical protein
MTDKAGLEWKLRGYPYKVTLKNKNTVDTLDWCAENLTHGSYVGISYNELVFSSLEFAAMYKLTWAYD